VRSTPVAVRFDHVAGGPPRPRRPARGRWSVRSGPERFRQLAQVGAAARPGRQRAYVAGRRVRHDTERRVPTCSSPPFSFCPPPPPPFSLPLDAASWAHRPIRPRLTAPRATAKRPASCSATCAQAPLTLGLPRTPVRPYLLLAVASPICPALSAQRRSLLRSRLSAKPSPSCSVGLTRLPHHLICFQEGIHLSSARARARAGGSRRPNTCRRGRLPTRGRPPRAHSPVVHQTRLPPTN
jgi:hypothetical protein